VLGGGNSHPPTLQYTLEGQTYTKPLKNDSTYTVDGGTYWSVSSFLPGGNSTQRWTLSGSNDGNEAGDRVLTYYRQENVTFSYTWVGNGQIFPLNKVNYTSFGITYLQYPVFSAWADYGSPYSYGNKSNNNLPPDSRWFVVGRNGTIGAPGTIAASYFEQYLMNFGVSASGPDGFKSTTLTESYGGALVNHTLTTTGGTFWVDYNSTFSLQQTINPLGADYRWSLSALNDSFAYSAGDVQAQYTEQFPLTVQIGVSGGAEPSPPEITAMADRQNTTSQLASGTTVTWVDAGSGYQVTNPLLGSSPNERWFTPSGVEGVANGPSSLDLEYYHQILVPLDYAVVGGGSVPPFNATYTTFGSAVSVPVTTAPSNLWVDFGTSLGVPGGFAGSSQFERWNLGNPPSTPLTTPGALTLAYYHQFYVPFVYTVSGQGSPPSPILTGSEFGAQYSWPLSSGTSTWLDGDSSWSVTGILQSAVPDERWEGSGTLNGTVNSGTLIIVAYQDEYYVSVGSNPVGGGTLSGGGWVKAGQAVGIATTPSQGFAFAGWLGSGAGSYSGRSENYSVTVSAPLQEVAQYYVALLVQVSGRGSVSVMIGSSTYTIGNQLTLYLPPGTNVTLVANPGLLETFSGWQGIPAGSTKAVAFSVETPLGIGAPFTIDLVEALGVVTLYAGIAAFVIIYLVWNRRPNRIMNRVRSSV